VIRLVWSPQAIEDVEAVRSYVAAADRLESFPLSGRVVPEVGDESLREVVYGNYRMVYRVKAEAVEIVTVFHSARLLRLE
jgi:plasmid stabilization system protein ParE